MKAVKIIEQLDNKSVGIYQDTNGTFTAMTFTKSKSGLKTLQAAEKWLTRNYAGFEE